MTAASFSREIGLSHEVEGGTLLARRLDLYPSVGAAGGWFVSHNIENMISDRLN